jgi:hypothetical protein
VSTDGGGSAICTELHRQGLIPEAWFAADVAYARAYIDDPTRASYLTWAGPLVQRMQRSPALTRIVRPFGVAWAQHLAYRMGASDRDNWLGRWLNNLGVPIHRFLGRLGIGKDALVPIPSPEP